MSFNTLIVSALLRSLVYKQTFFLLVHGVLGLCPASATPSVALIRGVASLPLLLRLRPISESKHIFKVSLHKSSFNKKPTKKR